MRILYCCLFVLSTTLNVFSQSETTVTNVCDNSSVNQDIQTILSPAPMPPKAMEQFTNSSLLHQRFRIEKIENYLFTPLNESNSPTLLFAEGFHKPFEERFFNCFFGPVDRILWPKENEDYIIIVGFSQKEEKVITFSEQETNPKKDLLELDFRRIRSEFNYGHPWKGVTNDEKVELSEMIQSYTRKQAREIANAIVMASYPFSLCSATYKERYTNGRKLILSNGETTLNLYFLMTSKGTRRFNKILEEEVKGVFQL